MPDDVGSARLVAAMIGLVGDRQVLTGPSAQGYERDWTGRFVGRTPAVVRPTDVAQVAEVLAWCHRARVPVVPQGGNTGLVGGGVPLDDEVVLSVTHLDALGPIDHDAHQVTVGAGATLGDLHRHLAGTGLRFPVDLAARDSATVGGMVATNAGGLQALAFGPMRAQIRGTQAVLADGTTVEHLGGLEKDNTGYDLGGLLCGSEGTLGVVTAVRLRLVPDVDHRVVVLAGYAEVTGALAAGRHFRRTLPGLEAAELFGADGLELVMRHHRLPPPLRSPAQAYLLIEVTGRHDPIDAVVAELGVTDPIDTAIADDAHRRADLWRYREGHTDAIGREGVPHKLDVTLPASTIERFVPEVRAQIAGIDPSARCWLFGHVLDGNLHVNVTGLTPDDDRVDDAVLHLVASLGGSISAEHGIGRAKRRWLPLARSEAEIATFRAIKGALDPHGILNPNVLVGPPGTADAGNGTDAGPGVRS